MITRMNIALLYFEIIRIIGLEVSSLNSFIKKTYAFEIFNSAIFNE